MSTDYNIWAWDASATPLNNATADAQINWAEGQDPATVNNSARAMMTATKRWANVNSGNVVTSNIGDAYTITTGQSISSGHQALGFRICFKASATNTGAATVAVDGLSAVAIKRPNNDALSAGDIVSGGFFDLAFDGTNYKLLAAAGAGGIYGVLAGGNTWTGTNSFQAGATIGDNPTDVVVIKGITVHKTVSDLWSSSSLSALRVNQGLGTAAVYNTGTSGTNVPLLDGNNTWSAPQFIDFASGGGYLFRIHATDKLSTAAWTSTYFLDGHNNVCGVITHTAGSSLPSPGATTYGTSSDGRFKTDKRPIDNSGTIIDALNPIYFKWLGQDNVDFGFVAQDVEAIPQLQHTIVRGDDGDPNVPHAPDKPFRPYQMQHGRLEAILVAEIQALRARVAALEAAA